MSSSPRISKGRRKVEMKKMTKESNLQVTFSKRRSGLFKKASELCTLCGADVGLIVFSPGEKAFSFGHPNINAMVHRFLTGAPQFATHFGEAKVHELNAQLAKFTTQLEIETKRAKELKELQKVLRSQCWWASPITEMNLPQLKQFKEALHELKRNVALKSEMILFQRAINNPTHFYAGTSYSDPLPPLVQHHNHGSAMNHHGFTTMRGYGPSNGFY